MAHLLHRLRAEDGFTLPEILAGVVLLGILLPGIISLLMTTTRWSGELQTDSVLQGETRSAVEKLASELRQSYTGTATSPVETIAASSITFDSPDRGTPMHLLRVTYRVASGQLDRASVTSTNTGGPAWTMPVGLGTYIKQMPSVVANPGGTALFTYYSDGYGTVTAVAGSVKVVKITLSVATNTMASRVFTYSETVALRNLQ